MSFQQNDTLTSDDFDKVVDILYDEQAPNACSSFAVDKFFSDFEMKPPQANPIAASSSYNSMQDASILGTRAEQDASCCSSLDVDAFFSKLERTLFDQPLPSLHLDASMDIVEMLYQACEAADKIDPDTEGYANKTKGASHKAPSPKKNDCKYFPEKFETDYASVRAHDIIDLSSSDDADDSHCFAEQDSHTTRTGPLLTSITNEGIDRMFYPFFETYLRQKTGIRDIRRAVERQDPLVQKAMHDLNAHRSLGIDGMGSTMPRAPLEKHSKERKRRVTYDYNGTPPIKKRRHTPTTVMYEEQKMAALMSPEPHYAKRRIVQYDETVSRTTFSAPMSWVARE